MRLCHCVDVLISLKQRVGLDVNELMYLIVFMLKYSLIRTWNPCGLTTITRGLIADALKRNYARVDQTVAM